MGARSFAAVTAIVLALSGCAAADGAGAGSQPSPAAGAAQPLCGALAGSRADVWRVVVIVMENHSYGQLIGRNGSVVARQAPYLNGELKKRCGLATNNHGITHPSLPNYIAMVAGTQGGITDDCSSCTTRASSLFGQLRRNGASWRTYAEGMPAPCSHTTAGRYAKRHNPATYFPSIAAACRRFDLPLGGSSGVFAQELRRDRLHAFTLVVPDICHDMHDCPVSTGDAWLRRWVPRITATRSYAEGRTVVFVTWDEGGRWIRRCGLPGAAPRRELSRPSVRPFGADAGGRALFGVLLALLAASNGGGAAGDAALPRPRRDRQGHATGLWPGLSRPVLHR